MGDHNPRYKTENILNMELDMPERTTFDFGGPSDHMQARRSWLCACLWPHPKIICCWQGYSVPLVYLLAC